MSQELLTLQDKIGQLIVAFNALKQENDKLKVTLQKQEATAVKLQEAIDKLNQEIGEKNLIISTKVLDEPQKEAMKIYLDAVLQKIEANLKLLK